MIKIKWFIRLLVAVANWAFFVNGLAKHARLFNFMSMMPKQEKD